MKRCVRVFFMLAVFNLAVAATTLSFKQYRVVLDGELTDLASGDLNKDKRDDIVALNTKAKEVRIFMGDNNFKFTKQFTKPFSYLGEFVIGIADFTGDGKLDVAVDSLYYKTYFALFPGKGNGELQNPKLVNATGTETTDFSHAAVVDVNADGKPDIAALLIDRYKYSSGSFVVFINKGGRFALTEIEKTKYSSLTTGDVDGDNDPDLIVGVSYTHNLAVFLNNGNGSFVKGPVTDVGSGSSHLRSGYVNGDGRLDVVGNSGPLSSGWCVLGKGDGTFINRKTLPKYEGLDCGFVLADFDGDGKLDLAEPELAEISLFSGLGTGRFKFLKDIAVGLYFGRAEYDASNLIGGDFNGDKKIDLAGYHWDGYNNRKPAMTDLMVFRNGTAPTTCSISDLNVIELRYAPAVIYFSGTFNFINTGGDVRNLGNSVVTDNAHLEFEVELDFPYPLKDYTLYVWVAGNFLNYPGLTSSPVSFNLTLPVSIFTTSTATMNLANFSLWDCHLVHSNILLKD